MNVRLLIEAIVRQTTVLLAELATSGGLRAPLANVADRVFIELARELDGHGVSRSVSADMFGMALRTYLRRIRRYDESVTVRGASLWEAVLRYVEARPAVSRSELLDAFAKDDEGQIRSVLQDLTDSGLIFRSGVRTAAVYRAASPEDVGALGRAADQDGTDSMIWAIIRREGPMSLAALAERAALGVEQLRPVVERLKSDERIEQIDSANGATFSARSIVIPVGSRTGWEGAVYDHFHAVVKTVVCKLRMDSDGPAAADRVGGSTYGFDVWDGHPFAEQVYSQLARYRAAMTELRGQVDAFNDENPRPARYDRVTAYFGQCIISEENDHDS